MLGSVRADFPALAEITHLNCAGIAPLPTCVSAELLRLPQYVAAHGPASLLAGDEELIQSQAAHRTVAAALGITVDEIAFTLQFSTAASLIVEGLPWRAGDEILITDQEHPALLIPLLNIVRRFGVVLRRVAVARQPAEMLERCRVALSERTRLVAMSHITTETGDRLPVAEIARLAHQAGALVLYDGAQACGQLPVDLRAIDCDFYIVVGYKWLFGPFPSALVYLHRRVLERVEVTWTGSHAAVRAGIDMDELEFAPSARRFEFGGRPWASESAMAVGVDYVGRLGLAAIERHGQQLAVGLHQRLDDLPGAQIWSPREPALLNGIVTFSLAGLAGPTIVTALRERWGILTRPALQGRCVRAAMAAFTSEEDLDRLSRALATLVAEQRVGG